MSHQAPKKPLGIRINTDLIAEVRSFVRDNAGKPLYLSLPTFVEEALIAHMRATQRRLDTGEHDLSRRLSLQPNGQEPHT